MKFNLLMILILTQLAFIGCGQSGSVSAVVPSNEGDQGERPPTPSFRPVSESISANGEVPQVDILVVMDNSRSMKYEQSSISKRFSSFIDQLTNIDWQLAISTTDVSGTGQMKDGRFLKFKNSDQYFLNSRQDPDFTREAFSETIQVGSFGSGEEQGIKSTFRALERSLDARGENSSFIRDQAGLAIILVTDADETLAPNQSPTYRNDPIQLLAFIERNWPRKKVKFHSIIVKPGDENCLKDTTGRNENEDYGKTYFSISQMTDGIVGSVCEEDYGSQLSAIGDSTSDLIRQFTLQCNPEDTDNNGKVNLTVIHSNSGSEIKNFKVQTNKLIFDQPLVTGNYKVDYFCKK
jgi:hypothetical protein